MQESRESRGEGALHRDAEWINASNAANTADSNCNSTPETCITKIRLLQKTKSPATGHEYGVDEKGFNQLLEDMGISKEQREKLKPLSPQDKLLNDTLQREKRNLQALEKLLTKYEGAPGTSESLHKDLKEHVNKRRDYSLSGECIGRSQDHELDSEGDVATELIKTLFRGASGQDREQLLKDLAAELADSKCPAEKETGSLLNNTLEGVRALKERELPDIITPLVESAAQNADRWLRWPIMPWCIDDWLRRMKAKSSHAYKSHPNGIWKRFSHCFFNIIGAGNALLFGNGPRHQVGLPSCIYVFALTCPASQQLLIKLKSFLQGTDPTTRREQSSDTVEGNLPFYSASWYRKENAKGRSQDEQVGIIPAQINNAENLMREHYPNMSEDYPVTFAVDEVLLRKDTGQETDTAGFGPLKDKELSERIQENEARLSTFEDINATRPPAEVGSWDHNTLQKALFDVKKVLDNDEVSIAQRMDMIGAKLNKNRLKRVRQNARRVAAKSKAAAALEAGQDEHNSNVGDEQESFSVYVGELRYNLTLAQDAKVMRVSLVKRVTDILGQLEELNCTNETSSEEVLENIRQDCMQVTEHLRDYAALYYKVVLRRIAHQAVVVMMRDIEHNFSLPVFRAYVGLDVSPKQVMDMIEKAVIPAAMAKGMRTVAVSYDGAFSAMHCNDDRLDMPLNLHDLARYSLRVPVQHDACVQNIIDNTRELFDIVLDKGDLIEICEGLDPDIDKINDNTLRQDIINIANKINTLRQEPRDSFHEHATADAASIVLSILKSKAAKDQIQCPTYDINTATVVQLSSINSIGKKTAQRITAEREASGPFTSLEGGDVISRVRALNRKQQMAVNHFTTVDPTRATPGAGSLSKPRIKVLRSMAARINYLKQLRLMKALPVGQSAYIMGSNGFFSRPKMSQHTGKSLMPTPDATHALKHHRMAVCDGRFASSTPVQQDRHRAFMKMVRQTNGEWIKTHEMQGMHRQNVILAQKMFSMKTACMLLEAGELETARYVEVMAGFLDAFDTRGISIVERKKRVLTCRDFLLDGVDLFETGQYVKGVSSHTWKTTVVACDAFLRLCDMLEESQAGLSDRLCARALTTDDVENFFSLMGHQTKFMFEVVLHKKIFQMKVQSDPNRGFHFVQGKTLGRISHALSGKGFNKPAEIPEARPATKKLRVANGEGIIKGEWSLRATHYHESHSRLPKDGVKESLHLSEELNDDGENMYVPIPDLPEDFVVPDESDLQALLRYEQRLQQRTDVWYKRRLLLLPGNSATGHLVRPINASSLPIIFGLHDNTKMLALWNWTKGKSNSPLEPKESLNEALAWGTKNEQNAIATLLHHRVRKMGRDAKFYEEGLYRLGKVGDETDFVTDSPDGSIVVNGKVYAVEAKCPFYGMRGQCPAADSACRASYVLQVHAHMVALGARTAYLISWDPDSSTIYEMEFSDELWGLMKEWLLEWKVSTEPLKACAKTKAVTDLANILAQKATECSDRVASVRAV